MDEKKSLPLLSITLWPNKGMSQKQILNLLVLLFFLMMLPVIPFISVNASFVFLPFPLFVIFLLYLCLTLNLKQLEIYESIKIWPSLIEVTRVETNGSEKVWYANPYWATTIMYPTNQKVENYLTLKGNGREVELGAFLAPTERLELKEKIDNVMQKI